MEPFGIRYSGHGSSDTMGWEVHNFKSYDEAVNYAYDQAIQEFDSYAGMHGIGEEEYEDDDHWRETAESWIDYEAKPLYIILAEDEDFEDCR